MGEGDFPLDGVECPPYKGDTSNGDNDMTTEQQIAADLKLCDMIQVLGTRSAQRKARAHRKACFAAIAEMNRASGLDQLSDDELMAELMA